MTELAQGKVSLADLQELDLDDLLGREPDAVLAPRREALRQLQGLLVAAANVGTSNDSHFDSPLSMSGRTPA